MSRQKRLRMAVIGVGALGRHHARILAGLDDVELVAVVDTNPQRARTIAERHGTDWTTDYRDVLERIDAASVVVPTEHHLAVASELLMRRIPVFVEKPLAPTAHEAEQLLLLARRTHTVLQVGHVERFNPAFQVLRRLCRRPRYVRAERLSPYSFRSVDISVVHDMMIHDLDLVSELVPSPCQFVDAFGTCVVGRREDAVQARLHFDDGCVADLTASRVNPTTRRTLLVWSEHACVFADLQSRQVTEYRPTTELRRLESPQQLLDAGEDAQTLRDQFFGRFVKVRQLPVPQQDALTAELREFVHAARTGDRPTVDAEAGLRAVELADTVLSAVESHRQNAELGFPRSTEPRRRKGLWRAA